MASRPQLLRLPRTPAIHQPICLRSRLCPSRSCTRLTLTIRQQLNNGSFAASLVVHLVGKLYPDPSPPSTDFPCQQCQNLSNVFSLLYLLCLNIGQGVTKNLGVPVLPRLRTGHKTISPVCIARIASLCLHSTWPTQPVYTTKLRRCPSDRTTPVSITFLLLGPASQLSSTSPTFLKVVLAVLQGSQALCYLPTQALYQPAAVLGGLKCNRLSNAYKRNVMLSPT